MILVLKQSHHDERSSHPPWRRMLPSCPVSRGARIGLLVGDGAPGGVGKRSLAAPDARFALQAEPGPPPSHLETGAQGHELAGV